MIAKQAWKATKTRWGMVPTVASASIREVRPAYCSGFPMIPPIESPKAIE